MTQRKSKAAITLCCALVALAAPLLAVPSIAGAQSAKDEYNLTLPGSGGGDSGSGGSGSAGSGDAGSSSGSSGGGSPVVLIVLGAAAAACIGITAWRLRSRGDREPGQVPHGTTPSAGGETS